MIRRIFEKSGIDIKFERVPPEELERSFSKGVVDLSPGAFLARERAQYAYYSKPYRDAEDRLFVRKGDRRTLDFKDAKGLIRLLEKGEFRLGMLKGCVFASGLLNDYVSEQGKGVLSAEAKHELFTLLKKGTIDGILMDRIVGATYAWQNGLQGEVDEHPAGLGSAEVHVIFNKRTASPSLVEAFDRGLDDLRSSGEYRGIVKNYLFPSLLAQTIEKQWFLSIDIIGTIAFAISGLFLARKGRYDLFGALILAALPAVGGGMLRDILVDRSPFGVLRTPLYIYTILITLAAGYAAARIYALGKKKFKIRAFTHAAVNVNRIVDVFDAIGLAAFTVIGVVIAVESQCEPLWIWGPVLAALTSTGGGILRDIARSDPEISVLKGAFYPEIALIWGLFLSLFIVWQVGRLNPDEIFYAVIITLTGGFVTRLAVIFHGVKSPVF